MRPAQATLERKGCSWRALGEVAERLGAGGLVPGLGQRKPKDCCCVKRKDKMLFKCGPRARWHFSGISMQLVVQPLTAAAFAPYGHVVQVPGGTGRLVNGGTTERFDVVLDLHLDTAGSHAMLALFRAQARQFPHAVAEMERHALGSQTFVPLGHKRFVLVVAAAGPAPHADALAAFVTNGEQGVVLAPGTWHHALLALDAGDYVVLERAAAGDDCDLCTLATPVSVMLCV